MNRTFVNSAKHDTMIAKPQTSALLRTAQPQLAGSLGRLLHRALGIEHLIFVIFLMQ